MCLFFIILYIILHIHQLHKSILVLFILDYQPLWRCFKLIRKAVFFNIIKRYFSYFHLIIYISLRFFFILKLGYLLSFFIGKFVLNVFHY